MKTNIHFIAGTKTSQKLFLAFEGISYLSYKMEKTTNICLFIFLIHIIELSLFSIVNIFLGYFHA